MEFLFLDERTLDELFPTSSDFLDGLGLSAIGRAAIIWQTRSDSVLVDDDSRER